MPTAGRASDKMEARISVRGRKMIRLVMWTFLAVTVGVAQAAQIYRWTDANGGVHYSNTPPPLSATSVEHKNLVGNTIDTSELPYGVRQTVKNFPVTLWVNDCGKTCDDARALLTKRGIPYTSLNPEDSKQNAAFKKLTNGRMELPVLVIGNLQTLNGYEPSAWNQALDTAGYPKAGVLPAGKAAAASKKR
jgi:glutaredoxin